MRKNVKFFIVSCYEHIVMMACVKYMIMIVSNECNAFYFFQVFVCEWIEFFFVCDVCLLCVISIFRLCD